MKKISITAACFIAAISCFAQQNVSITINGNKNPQITVDGRIYSAATATVTGNKITISLGDIETGQHTFEVSRTAQNTNIADRISSTFNLRYGYNMLIRVNANGSLELIETKGAVVSSNHTPMRTAEFNILLKNVTAQRSTNTRRTVIANAYNNTNNYFSTNQSRQLLQLINSENYRLELAKLSYRSITDRSNFNQLYSLLNSQASRDALEDYVNNYTEENELSTAMTDVNFNALYQNIQQQRPVGTQLNSLTNAFNNNNHYFTVYQARQLIQIVSAENSRLQLAKLSYPRITDPANFSQMNNLFSSQASRNELETYVNTINNTGSNTNTAMPEASFNSLYQTIQQQWPATTQVNSITNAFNNSNNYFTVYQARQLIQIVTAETSRLQLAKLSYRRITDPANFSQMNNLFYSQSGKDELAAYINNNSGTVVNTNVAMADADFRTLYQSIQQQFFPGEKMNSLTLAFNNTNNFFSSSQAKQLIQLVSSESNRLQLAKLSYRTISDRNNFEQLYDLLDSQASRDELAAYIKAYRA